MADTFSKPSNQQQKLKWARVWFDKLVGFHGIASGDAERWDFSADQVSLICVASETRKRLRGSG